MQPQLDAAAPPSSHPLDSTPPTATSNTAPDIRSSTSTSSMNTTRNSSMMSPLQQRQQHYGPNIALSYDSPLLVERGEGCWLFDEAGTPYLDCVNNVAHVGHGNAAVASAVCAQLTQLNTNSRYLSRELNAYCQELAATLPHPLEVVYLVNSGSEANDLALRIAAAAADAKSDGFRHSASPTDSSTSSARCCQQQQQQPPHHVVVMSGAYHGHLSSMIQLSPYKFWGPGGGGKPDWVHVLPAPDTYRGLNLDGAAAARGVLAQAAAAGGRVVAFFCESIISCGGQLFLPPGYLQSVYEVMRAAGVVCVADEVQTGFGRTGGCEDVMWAFQHQQVVPDIVTMGKPMGNGFPIGGVVTSPALAAAFAAGGMEYFNTYGGSNAAVAAGRAVLREIRDRGLQQHADEVGRYMLGALQQLQREFPALIADVRGMGLFAGLELCTNHPTAKTPAPLAAKTLKEGAKAHGVLLSTDGPVGHVVKVKPPLVGFGVQEVDLMVGVIREVLSGMTAPEAWRQLQAAEQQHYSQHVEPILSRYRANEQQVWAAAAAVAAVVAAGGVAAVVADGVAAAAAEGAAVVDSQRVLGGSSGSLSDLDCSVVLVGGPELCSGGGGVGGGAVAEQVAVKQ